MGSLGPVNVDGQEFKASGVHLLADAHITQRILLLIGKRVGALLVICQIDLQLIPSKTHKLIAEAFGADTEKGRIISQRIKHLAVGNTPGHHNVGRRMGLWGTCIYLLTGPDVPVRHIVGLHSLFPFRLQPLSLSHRLHDGEGQAFLHALADQIKS